MSFFGSNVPLGWEGGFLANNPQYNYPNPDLSNLQLTNNLDNIPSIQRLQKAWWPEFSWQTTQGEENTRCFQMFAPDISRIGYDNTGKSWSIMCPQQGVWISPWEGTLNVEVTVTGQKGWVNEEESTSQMYAEMTVTPQIWFSPDTIQNSQTIKDLWWLFDQLGSVIHFPSEKQYAIKLNTYSVAGPNQPVLQIRDGLDTSYTPPGFATHQESWNQANVEVVIGKPQSTGITIVDDFNQEVMNVFNTASGNMLLDTNTLSWNIWFLSPEIASTQEWQNHADWFRWSIDVNHRSPEGDGTDPRLSDGTPYNVIVADIISAIEKLISWLWGQIPDAVKAEAPATLVQYIGTLQSKQ